MHPLPTPNFINFNHAGVLSLSGCLRFYFFFSYFKTNGRKSGKDKGTTSEGKLLLKPCLYLLLLLILLSTGKVFSLPTPLPSQTLMFPLRNCLRGKV